MGPACFKLSNHPSIGAILMVIFSLTTTSLFADDKKDITTAAGELNKTVSEMREKLIPLLTLVKQLENKQSFQKQEIARMLKSGTPIRNYDNQQSPALQISNMNEEFVILNNKEDWFNIRLPDGRNGWIKKEEAQLLLKDQPVDNSAQMTLKPFESVILKQIARLLDNINQLNDRANKINGDYQKKYNRSSDTEKQALLSDYQKFINLTEKQKQYYQYAVQYTSPYQFKLSQVLTVPGALSAKEKPSLRGDIGLSMGKSSYSAFSTASEFSNNFTANGILTLSRRNSLSAGVNYQQEVIQTPFSMTQGYLGYNQTLENGLTIETRVGISNYKDKNRGDNNFNSLDGHFNISYPFGHNSSVYAGFLYSAQKYKLPGGSNYSNSGFLIGSSLKPNSTNTIRLQLAASIQTSDMSFLQFNRFSPLLEYTIKAGPKRSFHLSGNIEAINYDEAAKSNNYFKQEAIFGWSCNIPEKDKNTNFDYTKKQYPFNDRIDYSRFGFEANSRKGDPLIGWSGASSFSANYTYYSLRDTSGLRDFLDLQSQYSGMNKILFMDLNIFSRIWNDFNRKNRLDDEVDTYMIAGPIIGTNHSRGNGFSSLRIGGIFGFHMLIGGTGDPVIKDGNSGRVGISAQGSYSFGMATLNFSGSYEKSILYTKKINYDPNTGEIIYGEVVNRSPSSVQFILNCRIPAGKKWDFKIDINYMDINTATTAITSINPIKEKIRLKLMAGLVYKFNVRNI